MRMQEVFLKRVLRNDVINMSRARDKEKISVANGRN